MKRSIYGGPSGQALIELLVLLPILSVLMAAAFPLLTAGMRLPWLDERLALRLSGLDGETVERELARWHGERFFPGYFAEEEVEEWRKISGSSAAPFPLSSICRNTVIDENIRVDLQAGKYWNHRVLGPPPWSGEKASRKLTAVSMSAPSEPELRYRIRKTSFVGLSEGMTGILERLGINLFHLNMDALPPAGTKEAGR